jgi:cytochrome P450
MGSRVCIGRHIAILEMTKLIPRIVRDLDFDLEDAGGPSAEKGTWPTQNVWFVKPTNFRLRVKARSLLVTELKD